MTLVTLGDLNLSDLKWPRVTSSDQKWPGTARTCSVGCRPSTCSEKKIQLLQTQQLFTAHVMNTNINNNGSLLLYKPLHQ